MTVEKTKVKIDILCPFMPDGKCHANCMLLLKYVDAGTVEANIMEGEGCCSLAVMASHISSEKHYGGNYLVKYVDYNISTSLGCEEGARDDMD